MKNEGNARKFEEYEEENGIFRISESIGRLELEIYRNFMVRIEKSPEWAKMSNVNILRFCDRHHNSAWKHRLFKFLRSLRLIRGLECAN